MVWRAVLAMTPRPVVRIKLIPSRSSTPRSLILATTILDSNLSRPKTPRIPSRKPAIQRSEARREMAVEITSAQPKLRVWKSC